MKLHIYFPAVAHPVAHVDAHPGVLGHGVALGLDMELPTLVKISTDLREILFILGHIYSSDDQRLK